MSIYLKTSGPHLPGQSNSGSNAELSKEYTFTAGLNQMEYNLPEGLRPNNVAIFINETKLVGQDKYTIINNHITLTNAPFEGTIVTIRTY